MKINLNQKSNQSGFTLIEVLASLLIFSTAIMGLMHAGTQNIRAVHILEQKQLAGMIADNQLLLMLYGPQDIKPGTRQDDTKMAGRNWLWKIETSETGTSEFYRVTITVKDEASEQVLISRTAFAARNQVQSQ